MLRTNFADASLGRHCPSRPDKLFKRYKVSVADKRRASFSVADREVDTLSVALVGLIRDPFAVGMKPSDRPDLESLLRKVVRAKQSIAERAGKAAAE